ncbi:MAG: HAD family phosphatase [Bacteroidetes bacterium]|nr:MAG: HAD family phosphatase [Bacteroidota bacterium]
MSIPSHIKNIIFDFGGVILNIDYKLTENAFAKLGLVDFSTIYSQTTQKDLFDKLETGRISPSEFREDIRKFIGVASDEEIDNAWNAMLLDLPEERVSLLDEVRKTHRIFLLSNTNEIHYTAFSAYMQDKFKRNIFSDVFEKAYVSHKVKMRKPDAAIFEFVLSENKLKKEETLFIDDSIQHIEGANKLGINTILLKKGETILSLFQ